MHFPDMNLLVALDALLDEGSVVGAARRMNLSPAAMSRTLTRIRHAVGDPILVRAGRGLVPTPKAMALRTQVRSVVEQAGQVFSSSDEVDLLTLERSFNLRANDVFIAPFAAPLLETMRQQAPRTVLRFVPEGEEAVTRTTACAMGAWTCTSAPRATSARKSRCKACLPPPSWAWRGSITRSSTMRSPRSASPPSNRSASHAAVAPPGQSTQRWRGWA
ncbi:UNVERIFIED_ORG: hypothetical protein OKW25_004443 [Pseudomonas vranovensis]|nr:hypothetical protein [Pseudomonas vranovensis]